MKNESDNDCNKWSNQQVLFSDSDGVTDDQQFLSIETSKIFENIIKKHNEQWDSFEKEEKNDFTLDFSSFVFIAINFHKFVFSQDDTNFIYCKFFGMTDFILAKFSWDANFKNVTFLGDVFFMNI